MAISITSHQEVESALRDVQRLQAKLEGLTILSEVGDDNEAAIVRTTDELKRAIAWQKWVMDHAE